MMSGEDSGVDAGSDTNSSDCMSLASPSDHERDADDDLLRVNPRQHDTQINFVNVLHMEQHLPTTSSYLHLPSTSCTLPTSSSSSSSSSSVPSLPSSESLLPHLFEHQLSTQSVHFQKDEGWKETHSDDSSSHNDIFSIPSEFSYTNEEQHDYCSKMRFIRQRRHEVNCKHFNKDLAGERMLRRAANANEIDVVRKLLNDGINPRASDERNRTALHFAACKGHTQIARLLLDKGANPNDKDVVGNTPLHLAACTNNIGVITLLLTAGTDINSLDNSGRTPLHLAQSKLKMLQQQSNMSNSNQIKNEILQVVEMMLVYLQRSGKNAEVELLSAFTSRLQLHQTREEVDSDVKDLLSSLSHLTL